MSQLSRIALAALCVVAASASTSANAQVVNGSFEDGGGSFNGWSFLGDALIQTASLGTGPTQGTHDALLATATDGTVNPDVPIGTGVSGAQLETFLGMSAGTLQGLGHGDPMLATAVTQVVSLQANDVVKVDWDFLTNQVYNDGTPDSYAPTQNNNDFAFLYIKQNGGSISVGILADTFYGYVNNPNAPGGFETGFTITPASNPFISETGFQTMTFSPSATDSYTIGFGVVHASTGPDNGINSALLIDNMRVEAVPEPATCTILGLCLAGLMRRGRRRR